MKPVRGATRLPASFALALWLFPAAPAAPKEGETRVSIDVRDADIVDFVRLVAEVGDFRVVVDPVVSCKLTLKLKDVPLETALHVALRSCGLGRDEEYGIVRVAGLARLTAELAERRRLDEERRLSRPLRTTVHRLSYARAQELAPLIKRFLSPRGDVVFDERTNTLFITDVQ